MNDDRAAMLMELGEEVAIAVATAPRTTTARSAATPGRGRHSRRLAPSHGAGLCRPAPITQVIYQTTTKQESA